MNGDSAYSGAPAELHRGVARQRLLEQDPQLEPRQRGAQAEVPPAGAEGLMVGVAGDVEAVGVLVAGLVAVRRHVPHHHLLALADRLPVQARCRAVAVRRKWAKAGNIRSDSSTALGISEGSSSRSWRSSGCSIRARMRAAIGRLGAVVTGGDEQEEPHHDLVLLQPLAVHLGMNQDAGEVVGGTLAALGDQRPAALEDLGHVAFHDRLDALRVQVGVAGAERGVHQPRPDLVVLGRDPHEAADHPRDDRLGDVGDQVARFAVRRGRPGPPP